MTIHSDRAMTILDDLTREAYIALRTAADPSAEIRIRLTLRGRPPLDGYAHRLSILAIVTQAGRYYQFSGPEGGPLLYRTDYLGALSHLTRLLAHGPDYAPITFGDRVRLN